MPGTNITASTPSLQLQLPVLADEVLAEAVMLFFLYHLEPFLLVDAPGGVEHAVGPERELFVAAAPGETDALLDEVGAQAQATGLWLDQEKPQFGDRIAGLYNKDATDDLAVHLGDPATLFGQVVIIDEVRYDTGDQSLEALVPAVLSRIKYTVPMYNPSHVARLVLSQQVRDLRLWSGAEEPLDSMHRSDQAILLRRREVVQHRADVLARARVERDKGLPASFRQT